MRNRARIVFLLGTAAGGIALGAGATAQEVTGLPGIVVEGQGTDGILAERSASATKTDAPVLETPQSISVITREQLDDQNPQTVGNALRYTAGVLSDPDATNRYDSVFIRGFGSFGLSTNFVSFLDGLRLPRGQTFAQFQIDPFLLERVEVLKGPSAVLYGQVSPGGIVNQISRDPSAEPYNELRIEGGTHGRIQAGYATRGAFDKEGIWQYSLSAIGRHAGTRYDDVEEQRVAVAPSIAWQPDANTRLVLRGHYQNDPEGGYFNSLYPTFLAPAVFRPFLDRDFNIGDPSSERFEREQWGVGYSFEHRFNDWLQVRSSTRYASVSTELLGVQMAGPLDANGIIPRQAVVSLEESGGLATDNQAVFTFATGALDHKLLAGLDHQRFNTEPDFRLGLASSLDVTNPIYGTPVGPFLPVFDNNQDVQQTGVYLQDQLAFGNWRTLLGIRHDWMEQETQNFLAGGAVSEQTSSVTTYRAGLLYLFENGLAPYASYATSFEPVIGVDAAGNAFSPTEGEQVEVGLKYEPTFMDALITVSAFDIRQTNVLTPGPVLGFNVQTGEIRSRGLEFETRGNVTDNVELIAALTLLDTEVTKSTVPTSVGRRPQAVPEYFASIWANYTFDRGTLDGLAVGVGARFVGSSFADDANLVEKDGYAIADLALRYDFGARTPALDGLVASLDVRNLFDEDYYTSCSFNIFCQYGSERQLLVGLRKTW